MKHGDLPALAATTVTQKQILDQWIDDIQDYNSLNIDHSGLIDWVNDHCSK